MLKLTVGGLALLLAFTGVLTLKVADGHGEGEPEKPNVPYAFTLEMPLFGGLKMTTEARSEQACALALAATKKKLLQEAGGLVRYELAETCKPAR